MRPWPSTGTRTTRSRPRPSRPSALSSDGCASSPTITVIGGAPNRPSRLDVPAGAREHGVARGRERREVRHRRAGDEAAAVRGRAGRAARRSQRCATCSSAAATGEAAKAPAFWSHAVASQLAATRHRQRAADDEAEEARAGRGHGRRRAGLVEQREHALGVVRLGQRLVEALEAGHGFGGRGDGPILDRGQVARGAFGGVCEQGSGGFGHPGLRSPDSTYRPAYSVSDARVQPSIALQNSSGHDVGHQEGHQPRLSDQGQAKRRLRGSCRRPSIIVFRMRK